MGFAKPEGEDKGDVALAPCDGSVLLEDYGSSPRKSCGFGEVDLGLC